MEFMGKNIPSNILNYNTDFDEELQDAILRTEDGYSFKIHRIFLAQRSEYFRTLFISEGNNKMIILIKEISGQTLQQILHYLYKGTLEINEQNLQDIMIATDRMLLDDLMQKCREFATQRMSTRDCLSLLVIAARHESLNIFQECSRYAKVHFEEIIKNFPEKIAEVPIEVLTELLKDDSLNVASEETVGTAIDIWLKADPLNRKQYIPDLLNCLRLVVDTPPNTKEQKKDIGISNPFCIEWNSFKFVPHHYLANLSIYLPSFLQRILYRKTGSRFPKYLHIVVKCLRRNLQSEKISEMYVTCDEELDFFRKFADIPGTIPDFINTCFLPDVVVPIGKYVYLFAWDDNVILRYDLLVDSLIRLPGIVNRFYYCIVELHSRIYALGGIAEDTSEVIDTVEYYDPDSKRWNRVSSVGRTMINGAVVMCGRIYALGHTHIRDDIGNTDSLGDLGETYNQDDLEETDFPFLAMMWMRVYDPITDTWNAVGSPRVLRRRSSKVVFDNRLYLIGARNNRCVQKYDPILNVWKRLPDLPFLYSSPKARVVAGRLVVFDNYHEENYNNCKCPLSPAVYWDDVTHVWQITDKSFVFYNGIERYRFVILDDPNIVRELVTRGRRSAVQWDRTFSSE